MRMKNGSCTVPKQTHYSAKAPLTGDQLRKLQRDALDIRATAKRKGVSLDSWEERRESAAARTHFELGCWLYHYTLLRKQSPQESLKARVNVLLKLFMSGIHNPGYQFYTVFDFGERQFDSMFEQGDAQELIAALREHLVKDKTGKIREAFDAYGWPLSAEPSDATPCTAKERCWRIVSNIIDVDGPGTRDQLEYEELAGKYGEKPDDQVWIDFHSALEAAQNAVSTKAEN